MTWSDIIAAIAITIACAAIIAILIATLAVIY